MHLFPQLISRLQATLDRDSVFVNIYNNDSFKQRDLWGEP
jgi:hypothetical protein